MKSTADKDADNQQQRKNNWQINIKLWTIHILKYGILFIKKLAKVMY